MNKAVGTASLAAAGLVLARWIRVRDRDPEVVIGDDGGTTVSERKYSCTGTRKGNVHGNCAESWWDHWWNDRPYCNTVEFWCELAGGKFKLERQ